MVSNFCLYVSMFRPKAAHWLISGKVSKQFEAGIVI